VISSARYVHTNIVAEDWRSLARFYQDVFGCTPVPPERNLSGPELEAGTGMPGARIAGVHLRLPGFGDAGPTLEIFQYGEAGTDTPRAVNRPGFAHIAFAVDSVEAARKQVLDRGGSSVGQVVTIRISPSTRVTWCYVRDPEGNVLELQSWHAGDAPAP
jgi:glyoxylase I family protein